MTIPLPLLSFRFLILASWFWVLSLSASPESPHFVVQGAAAGVDALPLKSTEVSASLGLGFAEVKVVQTYRNEGSVELNANYLFPAGTGAAVHGLTMSVGDRRVEAVVREKAEARRTFEAAKAAGKTSVLLEARRPNVFSAELARIRPGDTVVVELRYTERLRPDSGEFEWVFPTTIGPRYGVDASNDKAEPVLATPEQAPTVEPVFSLAVDLRPGFAVEQLSSPSHRVRWERMTDGARVWLGPTDEVTQNRDFLLRYRLKGDATRPQLVRQEWRGQHYLAVNWMPPSRLPVGHGLPRDFLFVVDVSGSMHGFPLQTAQQLLQELLVELRAEDTFNVLLFAGSQEIFAERPVSADPESIARALAFIGARQGGGGTELLAALRMAAQMPTAPGRARTWVVVTDGYVDVAAEAYALVKQNLGEATLFPFGIGLSVNRDLIARLARAGKTPEIVVEGTERAVEKARSFRHLIDSPVLTDTHLTSLGTGRMDPLPQVAPAYAGQPWSFVTRLGGGPAGTLRFEGTGGEGPFIENLNLESALVLPPGPLLAQAWARDRVDEWMDVYALGERREEAKRALIEIGLQYNLLTPFTSFVAVDTVVRPASDGPVAVTQPLLMPAGVSELAMGQAVPSAPEPGTWALLAVSGFSMGWWKWRGRRKGQA